MPRRAVWKKPFLEVLRRTANVTLAARQIGISKVTAYNARHKSEKFAAEWDEAIDQAVDLLEAEARRRALSGVEEPIFHNGQQVGAKRRFSDTLMIFLLKAHRPQVYRENVRVEHAGSVASRSLQSQVAELTPAGRRLLNEFLTELGPEAELGVSEEGGQDC